MTQNLVQILRRFFVYHHTQNGELKSEHEKCPAHYSPHHTFWCENRVRGFIIPKVKAYGKGSQE